jgi:hypothetical protein
MERDKMKLTIKKANEITGGLSNPSKMPCKGYNLPANECKTGAKLRKVNNSVCNGCYALKGNYIRFAKTIFPKMYRALDSIKNPQWINAMSHLINNQSSSNNDSKYFRWHDSGDIQSIDHLRKIALICENTPTVKHWLPTREYKIVKDYLKKYGSFPKNLIVRLSAHMVNDKAPNINGLNTSTVGYDNGFNCIASKQSNQCLDCRACWDNKVKNVNYKLH